MKKSLFVCLLLLVAATTIFGQDISFGYDADGNLESRYVIPLEEEEEEGTTADIFSVDFVNSKITIYPNPTQGRIAVEITPLNSEQQNSLRLYDMNGKLLKSQSIVTELTALEITGAPGIYLLNIYLGENVSKWKIIKK
jgi:hypothetical protein